MDQQTTGISKRVTAGRTDDSRSIDEIRQDIENSRNEITDTVDLLGEKLKETFDWRAYLNQYPVVAVGGATLLGFYLGRKLFAARRRPSDTDQLLHNLVRTAAGALRPKEAQKPLLLTLLTMGGKYLLDAYQQQQQELAEQQHLQEQMEQLQALHLLQQQQLAGQQNQLAEQQQQLGAQTNHVTGNPVTGYHRVAGRDF